MDSVASTIPAQGQHGANRFQGITETMLIPLWAKAMETQSESPMIVDHKAVEMVNRIDYDFSKFKRGSLTQVGVSVRTLLFDEIVRAFAKGRDQAVIVNLGAGLDTRRHRLALANACWHDVDVAEAMAWRRAFFSEDDTWRFIEKSIFDYSWMEDIPADQPPLILAEGLFMYFPQERWRPLFQAMADKFPGADLYFEMLAPIMVGMSRRHDTVKMTADVPEFLWGIKRSADLNAWSPNIRFVEEWNYFDHHKARWGAFGVVARLPLLRPWFASRIVHVRFGDPAKA